MKTSQNDTSSCQGSGVRGQLSILSAFWSLVTGHWSLTTGHWSLVTKSSGRKKGQALVELALLGTLLGMMLAAAVDLGRAYYTSIVVANMAGEGAAYAANHPDQDLNLPVGTCAVAQVMPNNNIQDRARQVATDRGLIISNPNPSDITVQQNCQLRRVGQSITVKVTYHINDLFLPGLLGVRNLTISKTASQYITKDAYCAVHPCP